jgi:hypothetical protein
MSSDGTYTTICVIDPNAPVAKVGFDVWLFLAYTSILFSYLNINVLVFRFWLIVSAIFFIVWCNVPERAVQVDQLVFNVLFIIINIVQMIPLARQIWPVSLTPLEEKIFDRDFHIQMNKRQFKRFYERVRIQNFKTDKASICTYGSNFDSMIYIAKLSPGWKVCLYDKNGEKLQELTEGSWIGTIEFVIYDKTKPEKTMWEISAVLEERQDFDNYVQGTSHDVNLLEQDVGCIINYVDIKVIFLLMYFNIGNRRTW